MMNTSTTTALPLSAANNLVSAPSENIATHQKLNRRRKKSLLRYVRELGTCFTSETAFRLIQYGNWAAIFLHRSHRRLCGLGDMVLSDYNLRLVLSASTHPATS